jgi:hypothetical protein
LAQTLTPCRNKIHLTDAYYTPEGERKRILALPIEEGREYFETREAFLTYVQKHMTAYFDAKEKGSERRLKDLLTPGTSFSLQLFCVFTYLSLRLDICRGHSRVFPSPLRNTTQSLPTPPPVLSWRAQASWTRATTR